MSEKSKEAKFLGRALDVFKKAYFSGGPDRALNQTRFYDLLSQEDGADDWPDDAFLGDEIPDDEI